MSGSIGQLSVASLRPTHAYTPAGLSTNGIRAQAIDGILWVSQLDGGPTRNYCADPVSGRPRAGLPLAVRRAYLLTADAQRLYYVTEVPPISLMSLAIPAACR